MKPLGIVIIVLGIAHFIETIIFRDKHSQYAKNIKVVKGKEDSFFKIQLFASALITIIFFITGTAIIAYNLESPLLISLVFAVPVITYIAKVISKVKGYIEH